MQIKYTILPEVKEGGGNPNFEEGGGESQPSVRKFQFSFFFSFCMPAMHSSAVIPKKKFNLHSSICGLLPQ
jgi:hypothetical protein